MYDAPILQLETCLCGCSVRVTSFALWQIASVSAVLVMGWFQLQTHCDDSLLLFCTSVVFY